MVTGGTCSFFQGKQHYKIVRLVMHMLVRIKSNCNFMAWTQFYNRLGMAMTQIFGTDLLL